MKTAGLFLYQASSNPKLYVTGDLISGYVDGGYRTGDALTFGLVSGRIAGASL